MRLQRKPEIIKAGGLTIANRTGQYFGVRELMELLERADYSHLPNLKARD